MEQFIGRFVQHIPDVNFRMIRYYGFLANSIRGKLLPIIYQLLGQQMEDEEPMPSYASLMQKAFGFNPLACILCGNPLLLRLMHFGKSSVYLLRHHHRELALLKKINA